MSSVDKVDLSNIYTVMRERHSVRAYDPLIRIPREELKEIIELATTAPSSSNLQPWRFLIIDNKEIQKQIHPITNNQQHVLEASAIIAVLGDLESLKRADDIYNRTVEAGYLPPEVKEGMMARIQELYGGLTPEQMHRINLFDAGLVSMQLMLAAKAKGYDTVPMGGYNTEKFAEALQLPETLVPTILIAIGKGTKPARQSVRLHVDEIIHWNSL
ncbi:nitroreductase family protein [Paenibacillus bouchesdurhonensis]|uniref:nitroreductase family protein n=1 Tax=Paenibacillus bouchesdurhonensis TaxID=1870990 RepID=UPI000DA61EF2|nr:nitroreductase family protein [Paenibacillus bouchesdurhonensis]